MITGVIVGTLVGFNARGEALVMWPGAAFADAQPALTVCRLALQDIGRAAVLQFEQTGLRRPVVLGLVEDRPAEHTGYEVRLDGERVRFSAERELVLTCGAAKITLTSSGKILLEGEYISSDSAGVQRIRGASVQIN